MNRDQIWQKLKDEKETVYGKKMLEVFLAIANELEIRHLEEALDLDYEVSDDLVIYVINRGDYPSREMKLNLLDKIISKKKDMGSKLMFTILKSYNPEQMKKAAEKMNLSRMTLNDIHGLFWVSLFWMENFLAKDVKENYLKIIQEMFGEKLKQLNIEQIFGLIKQILTVDQIMLNKLIDVLGGWKSIVEKMKDEISELQTRRNIEPITQQGALTGHFWLQHYLQLKIELNNSGLNKYFAEKIIENDKNAIRLAKFFYSRVSTTVPSSRPGEA